MAALDAPDGPLNGSGRLAVHVLICTMRPRAFRSAGRKAFTTDNAPKTLTSNSRRMASSGNTSSGPGVRIPALLISRSRPWPSPSAADTRPAQAFTSGSLAMSQSDRLTRLSEACTSASVIAVPKTAYPFSASPSAMSRPRPLPAPVIAADRPACVTPALRASLDALVMTCVPFARIVLRRRGPSGPRSARPPSVHAKHDFSLGSLLCHRVGFADLRERHSHRDGYDEASVRRGAGELCELSGIGVDHVSADDEAPFLGPRGLARDAADRSSRLDLVEEPLKRRPGGHGVRDRVE